MVEVPESRPVLTPTDEDDPNWFMITVVGLGGCFVIVASIYLVSALFYAVEGGLETELVVEAQHIELEQYRAEQAVKLVNIDQMKEEWLKSPR